MSKIVPICILLGVIIERQVILMENAEHEEGYTTGKGIFIFGALLVLLVICIIAISRNKKEEDARRDIKVVAVEGQAMIYRDGEGYKNAVNGTEIISGDVISTGADSYLSITMDGNKCIMVEPASRIIIDAKGDEQNNRTQITVEMGSVISDIREPLNDKSSYEVVTDTSIISVRGTIFRTTSSDEGAKVMVSVHHGSVNCKPYFSNETVVVESGKEMTYKGSVSEAVIGALDSSGYDDKVKEFIAEAETYIDNNADKGTDDENDQCVVQFIYDGEVFVSKTVTKGSVVDEPVIYPETDGEWEWDFSRPVTEDMKIEWK